MTLKHQPPAKHRKGKKSVLAQLKARLPAWLDLDLGHLPKCHTEMLRLLSLVLTLQAAADSEVKPCHPPKVDSECHAKVMYGMLDGFAQHPEKYVGLTTKSNYRDFQAETEKSVASSSGFVCLSAVAAQGEAFRGPREVQGAEPMGQSTSGRAPPSPPSCMRFTISHEEVAEHNEETDCWVIIGDSVLDVTQYISIHPGGKQAILNLAGGDATEIFDLVHQRGVIKKYGLRERTITLMGMLHR
eukprot:symbB.v1.2.013029.t1/scaffold913.1/size152782/7